MEAPDIEDIISAGTYREAVGSIPSLALVRPQGPESESVLISRLPPEVLGRIFQFCAPPYVDGKRDTRWTAFTLVCRYWYRVAVEIPTIWTTPPIQFFRLAGTMLRRAKGAAIDLNLRGSEFFATDRQSELVNLILPKKGQIRLLNVGISNSTSKPLTRGAAPLLEDLTIASLIAFKYPVRRLDADVLPYPAPRLRALSLTACIPFPDSKLLQNLSRLSLSFEGHEPEFFPNFTELLMVIGKAQRLSELELNVRATHYFTVEGPVRSALAMPNLRVVHLNVERNLYRIADILESLDCPSLTDLTISTAGDNNDASTSLYGWLANWVSVESDSSEPWRSMEIQWNLFFLKIQLEAPRGKNGLARKLDFTMFESTSHHERTTGIYFHKLVSWELLPSRAFTHINTLRLRSMNRAFSKDAFSDTFGSFPSLTDLTISGQFILRAVLETTENGPPDDPLHRAPLDQFRFMSIEGSDLCHDRSEMQREPQLCSRYRALLGACDDEMSPLQLLIAFLSWRTGQGVPMEHVSFVKCGFARGIEPSEVLKGLVSSVSVKGTLSANQK